MGGLLRVRLPEWAVCPLFVFQGHGFDARLARQLAAASAQAAANAWPASHGLELFDLQLRRESIGWVLRVVIDRPGPEQPGRPTEDSVGIEDCQRVSQDLSALLDVEDELDGSARQLHVRGVVARARSAAAGEADYRRFAGRLAKIVTPEPVDGQSHFAGRLAGVEAARCCSTRAGGHRVPLAIARPARRGILGVRAFASD